MFVDALPELVATALGWAFGSLKGFSAVAAAYFGAKWLRKGAVIGLAMNVAAWYIGVLGVLILLGVIDFNPGAIINLGRALIDLIGVLLPPATHPQFKVLSLSER